MDSLLWVLRIASANRPEISTCFNLDVVALFSGEIG